ncbi:MAG: histidinol-phosphate transaminase [Clostridia bacterium]|nr:histidinol-phosphate transaminase [Clostridia bacterium]
MSEFFNPRLASLSAYTPGEQPRDKQYIKLNTNESPFPPAPEVIKRVTEEALGTLRLYCDPTATALKNALASRYGVKAENVFVANGSDDILNFAFLAFGQSGVAFPDISYGFYEVFAHFHGIPFEKIPLQEDFTVRKDDYFGKEKMVCIANPNAPTGIALSLSDTEDIVSRNPSRVVLIDEAYVDFGAQSCVSLTQKYKNLLCVGTFSKSRSMAGGRLGFAIASKELITDLEKIKYSQNPYNVNTLTQLLGVATLENDGYYKENCQKIISARRYTEKALCALGFTVLPSKANFVFAKSERISGKELYLRLKEKGILVRHFDAPRIEAFNRITVGTQEQMELLVAKITDILAE